MDYNNDVPNQTHDQVVTCSLLTVFQKKEHYSITIPIS